MRANIGGGGGGGGRGRGSGTIGGNSTELIFKSDQNFTMQTPS